MGHSKLYLLDEINDNYVLAGMSAYYSWHTAPDPDNGRRYFGDYDKQQNPSVFSLFGSSTLSCIYRLVTPIFPLISTIFILFL